MRIRIFNFQPFSTLEIEAQGLTVLQGRSNLGKSSLIRAIESALFNREGEYYIRHGSKTTRVELLDLPGGGNIEWEKTIGVSAKFKVNGEDFSKLAGAAPPLLQQLGYKDIWIGDKERKRGEFIRPQVSDQFDRIFLLERPGSFVAEVLSSASRISVLTTADRACSQDLKANKSLLNVREADLKIAVTRLEAMQPIVALRNRVALLKPRVAELMSKENRRSTLASLLVSRKKYSDVNLVSLPELKDNTELIQKAQTLTERSALLASLISARAKAQGVPALPSAQLDPQPIIVNISEWMDKSRALAEWLSQMNRWSDQLRTQKVAVKSLDTEILATQAELTQLQIDLKVCPVCEKPFEVAAV